MTTIYFHVLLTLLFFCSSTYSAEPSKIEERAISITMKATKRDARDSDGDPAEEISTYPKRSPQHSASRATQPHDDATKPQIEAVIPQGETTKPQNETTKHQGEATKPQAERRHLKAKRRHLKAKRRNLKTKRRNLKTKRRNLKTKRRNLKAERRNLKVKQLNLMAEQRNLITTPMHLILIMERRHHLQKQHMVLLPLFSLLPFRLPTH
ncbi:hypothetical protein KIN20_021965 [Parelaphostrongylus tenuis]|uniref:Uncharacterized protein n=1 Tax=Parelaphostrongylus tenuis TaxID=148309 RepID=A0AAD5QWI3_PARTN|nr:hypothetical protein KIN20_021965 [Parelaphostrongylus tenuis]